MNQFEDLMWKVFGNAERMRASLPDWFLVQGEQFVKILSCQLRKRIKFC